jgi:hypothetical protein
VVLARELRGARGHGILRAGLVDAQGFWERAEPQKNPGIFYFPGFLKAKNPYFCNPFWGIFLLSSVG